VNEHARAIPAPGAAYSDHVREGWPVLAAGVAWRFIHLAVAVIVQPVAGDLLEFIVREARATALLTA
jgi:hypothetical protein